MEIEVFLKKGLNFLLPKELRWEVHEKSYDVKEGLQFLRYGCINMARTQAFGFPLQPKNLNERAKVYDRLVGQIANQRFGTQECQEKIDFLQLYKIESIYNTWSFLQTTQNPFHKMSKKEILSYFAQPGTLTFESVFNALVTRKVDLLDFVKAGICSAKLMQTLGKKMDRLFTKTNMSMPTKIPSVSKTILFSRRNDSSSMRSPNMSRETPSIQPVTQEKADFPESDKENFSLSPPPNQQVVTNPFLGLTKEQILEEFCKRKASGEDLTYGLFRKALETKNITLYDFVMGGVLPFIIETYQWEHLETIPELVTWEQKVNKVREKKLSLWS